MKSREKFAEEVANTIRKEHAKDNSASFIFGISSKWGEGKTFFLNQLESKLNGFKVVKINPWKYAADRTSFLRYFLNELRQVEQESNNIQGITLKKAFKNRKNLGNYLNELKKRLYAHISRSRDWLNNRDKYRKLNFDISENTTNWGLLILVILYSVLLNILYFYRNTLLDNTSLVSKPFHQFAITYYHLIFGIILSLVFTFLIPLIGQIIVTKRSSRSISTIDQFDDLLSEILSNLKNYKIVIFVDDLDRVTPQVARDVLDNLRTFFDRKELSFVVTGDHTVLERYIGSQTLPQGSEGDKLEEGRRFLKKIFNFYWRLPVPIDQEFNSFVEESFSQNKDGLAIIFKEEDLNILKSYLDKYFEKNFRQVTRFLDTVSFTFKIIEQQLESSEESDKKYFKELKDNPLLVVRILMIQDLCTPLFEEMLKDFNILFDLEYAAEKADNAKIESIISQHDKDLSASRKTFISQFLFEKPRFYEDARLTVSAMQPFLYLAADASFGDARGPQAADFTLSLQTNDPEQIKKSLLDSGELRIKDAAQAASQLLTSTDDINQRNNYLKALINSLISIPPEHTSQAIFADFIMKLDLTSVIGTEEPLRIEIINLIWKWLDLQKEKDMVVKYKEKFPFTNVADNFNTIDVTSPGIFTSSIVANWLVQYYGSNKQDSIEKMIALFPKLNKEEVGKELDVIKDSIINDIITNEGSEDLREKRTQIVESYVKDGLNDLQKKVFETIKQGDGDVWTWASSKQDTPGFWTSSNLQTQLVNSIKETTDAQSFVEAFRFCSDKINNSLKEFWDVVVKDKFDFFMDNVEAIIDDTSYTPLVPATSTAIVIFKKIVAVIESSVGEDNKRIELLNRLAPDKWIWSTYNHLFAKRDLKKVLSNENQSIRENAERIVNLWSESHKTL